MITVAAATPSTPIRMPADRDQTQEGSRRPGSAGCAPGPIPAPTAVWRKRKRSNTRFSDSASIVVACLRAGNLVPRAAFWRQYHAVWKVAEIGRLSVLRVRLANPNPTTGRNLAGTQGASSPLRRQRPTPTQAGPLPESALQDKEEAGW